ncbi:uncharacterized protein isoform X2 [Macaca fascicularis]|uniref:uncharacterized protein isoform X2 n=1 Tax=Macaca fascicularis TaxID=9541 RepID=UPI0032B05D97
MLLLYFSSELVLIFLSLLLLVGKAQFAVNRFGSGLTRLPAPRRQETTSPGHLPSQSGLSAGIHPVTLPTTPGAHLQQMLNMLLLRSKDEPEDRGRTFPSAGPPIFPVPQGQGPHRRLPQSQGPHRRLPQPTAAYPGPPHHRTCSRLRLRRSAWTPPETEIHSGPDSVEGNKKTEKRDRRLEDVQGRAGGKTPPTAECGRRRRLRSALRRDRVPADSATPCSRNPLSQLPR